MGGVMIDGVMYEGAGITSKAFGIGRRIPIVKHYKYQEE